MDRIETGAICTVAGASWPAMIQRSTSWYEMDKASADGMMLQYTRAIDPVVNAISGVHFKDAQRTVPSHSRINDATRLVWIAG